MLIVDDMLIKTGKWLRFAGIDTCYYSDVKCHELQFRGSHFVTASVEHYLKYKFEHKLYLVNTTPEKQLNIIIKYFALKNEITPFTRCSLCNNLLQSVEKKDIIDDLPLKVKIHFEDFYYCPKCDKIYWPGTHYDKINRIMVSLVRT